MTRLHRFYSPANNIYLGNSKTFKFCVDSHTDHNEKYSYIMLATFIYITNPFYYQAEGAFHSNQRSAATTVVKVPSPQR